MENIDKLNKAFIDAVIERVSNKALFERCLLTDEENSNKQTIEIEDSDIKKILELGKKLNVDTDIITEGVIVEGSIIDFCKKHIGKFKKYVLTVLTSLLLTVCFANVANASSPIKINDVECNNKDECEITFSVKDSKDLAGFMQKAIEKTGLKDISTDVLQSMNIDSSDANFGTHLLGGENTIYYNIKDKTISGSFGMSNRSDLDQRDNYVTHQHSSVNTENSSVSADIITTQDVNNGESVISVDIENLKAPEQLVNAVEKYLAQQEKTA